MIMFWYLTMKGTEGYCQILWDQNFLLSWVDKKCALRSLLLLLSTKYGGSYNTVTSLWSSSTDVCWRVHHMLLPSYLCSVLLSLFFVSSFWWSVYHILHLLHDYLFSISICNAVRGIPFVNNYHKTNKCTNCM